MDAYTCIHEELYLRYGLLRPVYSLKNMQQIEKYELANPLCKLALKASPVNERREDFRRSVSISEDELRNLEGFHFEEWIKEIAEDRQLLLHKPAIPNFSPSQFVFLAKLTWDFKDIEIDFLAAQPETNILVVGSCKRNRSKVNCNVSFREPSDGSYG